MLIRNRAELEAWLAEQFWLEDAVVLVLDPEPQACERHQVPETARLALRLQVDGGYRAGEWCRIRTLHLRAHQLADYCIVQAGGFIPGNRSQGARLLDDSQAGLGFTLDVPGELRVAFASLEVEQSETDDVVAPWYSTREFVVTVPGVALPAPAEWVRNCTAYGLDVAWRYFAGGEVVPEQVPRDYTGWFLQLRSRFDVNPQGLFFRHCEQRDGRFSIHVENYDDHTDGLWQAAAHFLGSFAEATILCGNARFSAAQWREHLSRSQRES